MCVCVCVCVFQEGAREGREDHIQASGGSLYVVECIKLNLNEDEDKISLIKGIYFHRIKRLAKL